MTVTALPVAAVAVPAVNAARSDLVRRGALALLLAAPLTFTFHLLWQAGHGPTVTALCAAPRR
ncbi:MAG: hypothetical protein M3P48_03005 [Actinomycetota bacterium]|nr:hypothetical protein [Actinomycetota bacterium]